jgi:hypothetical protein
LTSNLFPGYSGRRAWWRLDPGKLKAVIALLELLLTCTRA